VVNVFRIQFSGAEVHTGVWRTATDLRMKWWTTVSEESGRQLSLDNTLRLSAVVNKNGDG
jgi:hypothetical protein